MVKSVENGTSLPPFLVKCYEMVSDESTNELISWSESNDSFIIWDESKFSSQLLPKYFKHSNFSSFVRQLNIYFICLEYPTIRQRMSRAKMSRVIIGALTRLLVGIWCVCVVAQKGFRKIDTDHWQFANESFIKGQKHLLKNIIRRKNNHNPVQKKSSQPIDEEPPLHPEEDRRLALWKEVESLKTDRNALTQELTNVRLHQETTVSKLLLLGEQLKGMEKNQQQMLSFIVMAMQSPEFLAQFFQPKEKSWRVSETGKSKLSEVIDDCELTPSEGAIVRYQPPKDVQTSYASISEASTYEDFMDFDFSSDEMRDLLMDVDLLLGPGPVDGPFENHGQFVVPDVPENDAVLEQLLLPYSSTENEVTDSRVKSGLAFQPQESDKSDGSANDVDEEQNQITEAAELQSSVDTSPKVEVLIEKSHGSADDDNEDQNQMTEATEYQSSIDTSQKMEVLIEKSHGSADDVDEDQNQMTEATECQSSVDTSHKVEVLTEKYDGSAENADEDQNQMTEATEFQSSANTSQKVEVLTKQMGSLTSETRSLTSETS